MLNSSLKLNKNLIKIVANNNNKRIICHDFDVKKWTPYTWICLYDIIKNCSNRISEILANNSSFACGLSIAKEKVRSLCTLCLLPIIWGRAIYLLLGWVDTFFHNTGNLIGTRYNVVLSNVYLLSSFYSRKWRIVL